MANNAERTERRPRLILQATTRRDIEFGLPVSMHVAAVLRMDLAAFFVLDEALIEAARLPFATHVAFSGSALTLAPERLEAIMEREARACRSAIMAAAQRAGLDWTFQRMRRDGQPAPEAEGASGDIHVVRYGGMGAPAAPTIAHVRRTAPVGGGVMYAPGGPIRSAGPVLAIGRTKQEAQALNRLAAQLAERLGARAESVVIEADLRSAMRELRTAQLIIAPLDSQLLDDEPAVRRLVAAARAALLAVRCPALE